MGGKGRTPTPTALLALRGSSEPSRRKGEPALPATVPPRPDWLAPEAVAAWDHLVPLMAAAGVLTRVDQHALATWCATWARWRACTAIVERDGETYTATTAHGGTRQVQRPEAGLSIALAAELRQLGDRLGLNPAARTRLNVAMPATNGKPKPWQVLPGAHLVSPPPPSSPSSPPATSAAGSPAPD